MRTLAEIKEVKALAEKQKAGGLEIQEGLQLTERIRGLERRLVWSEAQKLEEIKELTLLEAQRIRSGSDPQAVKRVVSRLVEISVLRELDRKSLGELKKELEQEKLKLEAESSIS